MERRNNTNTEMKRIKTMNRLSNATKTKFAAILFFFFTSHIFGQDMNSSLLFLNPTNYNPAFTGLNQGMKVRMNYKKFWMNVPGENYISNLSLDIADRNLPGAGGIGLLFNQTSEGYGAFKTMNIGILPAVRVPLSHNVVIQFGAMAGAVVKQISWDGNFVAPDQLSAQWGYIGESSFLQPVQDKVISPDFSIGLALQFQGNNIVGTFGAAAHHIFEPNQSFFNYESRLPRKFVGHFDLIFSVEEYEGFYENKKSFKINPGVFYQRQDKMTQINAGLNFYMSHVYLGAWYRNEVMNFSNYSDLIFLAGLNITMSESTRVKLMYTYDMCMSDLSNSMGGTHEISLVFEFDNVRFTRSIDYVKNVNSRKMMPIECSPF